MGKRQDLSALVAAQQRGPGATIFKYLPVGARFVFDLDHLSKPFAILVKTKTGYRHEIGGRTFHTGARTACFQLPEDT